MSVVLVFILVVLGFAAWWLSQQRVMAKPWLEVGPDPLGGPGDTGLPTEKIALGIFLAVVGALFALFASAYFMRMEFMDWRAMPVPRIVWLNTGLLVLASVLLQCALVAARQGDAATMRLGLGAGAVATLGFLAGQLAAWRALGASGFVLAGNPADSFFYLLTGLHGLHILGGLVALARTARLAWTPALMAPGFHKDIFPIKNKMLDYMSARGQHLRLLLRLDLCAMYWHFLLLVWLALLVLVTGSADRFIAICRQILT